MNTFKFQEIVLMFQRTQSNKTKGDVRQKIQDTPYKLLLAKPTTSIQIDLMWFKYSLQVVFMGRTCGVLVLHMFCSFGEHMVYMWCTYVVNEVVHVVYIWRT